jgi:rare lipoprotein A
MSNGKLFNRYALTCAHRILPLGTRLKVSYKNKSVIVIVTDRISKKYSHRIDLSEAAFSKLANKSIGILDVALSSPSL